MRNDKPKRLLSVGHDTRGAETNVPISRNIRIRWARQVDGAMHDLSRDHSLGIGLGVLGFPFVYGDAGGGGTLTAGNLNWFSLFDGLSTTLVGVHWSIDMGVM